MSIRLKSIPSYLVKLLNRKIHEGGKTMEYKGNREVDQNE